MRTEYLKKEPPQKRDPQLNSNIFMLGIIIFLLFGCFAVAGPLGLFTKLSEFIAGLDPAPITASTDTTPVLLGLYTSDSLQLTAWEIDDFDKWMEENGLEIGISIAGTYMDFEFHNPEYNVPHELDAAWDLGYVPFVNLTAYQRTSEEVAWDPEFEERIRKWAQAYALWSNGGEKRAFIAPLQEMNGGWVRYGLDPENFKAAWHKIRSIFEQEGVEDDAVSWVFAPNAWSDVGHEFERYYPGEASVDVVAFSSLNWGRCVDWGDGWDTFEETYLPFLDRMREMAPGKPIFIAQIGSVAVGPDGRDDNLKNEWLRETFRKLAAYPALKGILYFNVLKTENSDIDCRPVDWRVYDEYSGTEYKGFIDAVRNTEFADWEQDSEEMIQIVFGRKTGIHYADIWPAQPFSGVEDTWYYPWVTTLTDAGLAIGCRMETYPFNGATIEYEFYCPGNPVTRAEMAVFIELALHGPGFWPPPAQGIFTDVPPDYWAAGWIELLAADGITSGCGENLYCPNDYVSRAQMAVFLGKAINLNSSTLPQDPSGNFFTDVGQEDWGAEWIEYLASEDIAYGNLSGEFNPDDPVTRAELAVFIVKAFNIPLSSSSSFLPDN